MKSTHGTSIHWRTHLVAMSAVLASLLSMTFLLATSSTAQARARLAVSPNPVGAGKVITITASGFRANRKIAFMVGVPQSEASPVGSRKANSRGHATIRVPLNSGVAAGKYVALACQNQCRVKASRSFRIIGIIGGASLSSPLPRAGSIKILIPGVSVTKVVIRITRRTVIKRMGHPDYSNPNFLSYSLPGAQIDVYLNKGRVDSIGASGSNVCMTQSFCIGDTVRALKRRLGSGALRRQTATDGLSWVYVTRYRGIRTYAAFPVPSFRNSAHVLQVFTGRCAGTSYC